MEDRVKVAIFKYLDDKIIKALKKKVNIASEVMGDTIQNWI